MKPMMKPTKKRLKFKEGDTVPGFDSPERRALLARARAFVEARGEGNDMSPAQEAMLRRQEGREYGLRGEEPPRAAARPAPRTTPAAPRASSRQELGNSWEESAGISSAPAATARASRPAMSTPAVEAEAPSRPRAADRQELGNSWDESAGYAPTPRRQAVGSSPDMYDMAQSSVPEMERERVRGEREIPPVTSPEQAQKLGRSIGQRLREELLSGGATDVRNMLSALAPGAGRMMSRGFGASEEMTRRSELGKAVDRATARRQSASEARRNRDVNRMEGESIGPVVPAMPVRPPRTKPNAKGNSRSRARQRSAEGEDQYLNSGQYKKGGMAKFAKGGAVSARADGIAQRGKTNCKMY
jgi:hypothetical protein